MSNGQPKSYKLDHAPGVPAQIDAIKKYSKQIGRFAKFIDIMEKAVDRLRNDPFAWGDPEYRSKHVEAIACHGINRPVVFRYVIYEQVRGVVLLSAKLYTDFD